MSDEENGSTVTGNSSSKNASEDLNTADAFSLLSKQLDNALQQQKNEIFNVLEAKIPAPSVDTSKKEFKFKYISDKNQRDFNESVSKDLPRIKSAVTAGNLPDALHLIDNSQQEITARNKKVKIKYKYGWDTVIEYEGNPLADDSDDEWRLRQEQFEKEKGLFSQGTTKTVCRR
jgi:predicted kinase